MDFPEDDFKGFGEGFEGFPKRLPEDCVEYSLFIIDSRLKSQKELLAQLENVRKESAKLVDSLLKEYIWQRDAFKLEFESGKGSMYLHGLTNYGDSVEDEWLIVYILKELSNRFPQLWIKVVDTDGEFLLIEAANALPRWLNPEIADNRVWIHQNKLRIIPRTAATTSAKTAPVSRPLTLEEAKTTIISTPEILIHSPLIEEEAFYRLRSYPAQITASLHRTLITIPRKLAYILHDRPASIAPAVEAFYLRDPIALKALQAETSTQIFPPNDLVTVSTRFTRVLYAQLKSQEFAAPAAWKSLLKPKNGTEDTPNLKAYDRLEIGMKVTSGFEMLVKDPKTSNDRRVRELNILLDDLASGDETLPSDSDIANWIDVFREDSETWLDINFEDFERELAGKSQAKNSTSNQANAAFGPDRLAGFGDAKTQADLKKMVERFEAFLNDENAGPEGVEMDDMDYDDDVDDEDEDDEDDDEESDDEEDKDVSFDEKEFARMMREMMGMPAEEGDEDTTPPVLEHGGAAASKLKTVKEDGNHSESNSNDEDEDEESEDEDEAEEIRKVMAQMEAELKEAGALDLDPKGKAKALLDHEKDEESDENVDIDFNLAKNLLESFKSQAGMAGPGGNMLSMMGMQLPRDDDDVKRLG